MTSPIIVSHIKSEWIIAATPKSADSLCACAINQQILSYVRSGWLAMPLVAGLLRCLLECCTLERKNISKDCIYIPLCYPPSTPPTLNIYMGRTELGAQQQYNSTHQFCYAGFHWLKNINFQGVLANRILSTATCRSIYPLPY